MTPEWVTVDRLRALARKAEEEAARYQRMLGDESWPIERREDFAEMQQLALSLVDAYTAMADYMEGERG